MNEILKQYIQDNSIPIEKRRAMAQDLDSGAIDEQRAVGIITTKYKGKYGSTPPAPKSNIPQPKPIGELMAEQNDIAKQYTGGRSGEAVAMKQAGMSNSDINQFEEKSKNNPIADAATGFIKGIGNTVVGASQLGYNLTQPFAQPIANAITGGKTQDLNPKYEGVKEEYLTPKNTAEAVGFGAEQIGEFLIPGGAAAKVGNVAKGAKTGAKLLGLGKKAAAEGLTSGGVAAIQEGKVGSSTAETAAFSAALPVAGQAMKKVGSLIKNKKLQAASNEIAKLIKPDKNAYLFGKNPALAVAQKGIVANSWDDLVKKISNTKNEAGNKIQKAVTSADSTKTTSIRDLIEKNVVDFSKKNADSATQKTYINKLQDLINLSVPDIATGEVKVIGKVPVEKLNAKGLWELQKKVGQLTKWTNQAGESEANKQLHKLYSTIGQRLDELAPGTKAAQTEYANFLGAEKAAKARAAVATRNTNALTTGVGILAGGASASVQGNPQDWLRNAAIGGAVPALLRSPLWKTRIAKSLAKESGKGTKVASEGLKALLKYGVSNLGNK